MGMRFIFKPARYNGIQTDRSVNDSEQLTTSLFNYIIDIQKDKGVPKSNFAAYPKHQEEEETSSNCNR